MYYLSSESVTPGHPDKMCDRISDTILDTYLSQDPYARVAVECFVSNNDLIIGWEVSSSASVDIEALARQAIIDIWYNHPTTYFDGHTCQITNLLHTQSPDIAQGVDNWWAWDQWIMFGYATNETPSYLPLTIDLAHRLAKQLTQAREHHILDYLLPDGKTQVTVQYDEENNPSIHTIVISTQHRPHTDQDLLKADLIQHVIKPVVGEHRHDDIILHINPTGIFEIWGPVGDAGLTGRKIIVDTYGGIARHGGGAFSGKDPTKVDRSGAYMARYLAKNIVASGCADRCEIQLSYAIGIAEPLSIYLETFWTEKTTHKDIIQTIRDHIDLTPQWIIDRLQLRTQHYQQTTAFWHFGRSEFSRESLDATEIFAKLLGKSLQD